MSSPEGRRVPLDRRISHVVNVPDVAEGRGRGVSLYRLTNKAIIDEQIAEHLEASLAIH